MTIEEILKAAGIEDAEAIAKVKAEMPKNFLPLADHNARIAKAKGAADEVQKAFDEYKAKAAQEIEAAKQEGEGAKDESAKQVEKLQKQLEELQGQYNESQGKIKQSKAKSALEKALKDSGANPAAVALLAADALAKVEFNDDGEPSNVADIVNAEKEANAGLFGKDIDTGKDPERGDGNNDDTDRFLKGFGEL